MRISAAIVALGVGLLSASGVAAAPSASALPASCEEILWGPFGTQHRLICDGPIGFDGTWLRNRVIGIPAGYRDGSSQCYGGAVLAGITWGYQHCSNTSAGFYDQVTFSNDTYRVAPNTVPGGEPGHLG